MLNNKKTNNIRLKHGSYSVVITVIVVTVLVLINVLASNQNIKFDLSENKMYTLSSKTTGLLKDLKPDVKIYALYQAGKESKAVVELLDRYSNKSKKISIEYIDPTLNPQFGKKYAKDGETPGEGSIIITSGKKYKTLSSNDLLDASYDQQTEQTTVNSIIAERALTGAIVYVTSNKTPVIYRLTSESEGSLPSELQTQLESENYTFKDVDLYKDKLTYSPNAILLLAAPKRDIRASDASIIDAFLKKGGKAIFVSDPGEGNKELPNLESVLKKYGVSHDTSLVVEGDANYYISGNPLYINPRLGDHEITAPLSSNSIRTLMIGYHPIEVVKTKKASLEIKPLLTTTENSWKKNSLKPKSIEKEAADQTGPFNLAVAITDTNSKTSPKLVVIANSTILDSQFAAQSGGGNLQFLYDSFTWLNDSKIDLNILPKEVPYNNLNMSESNSYLFSGIVVIVIPLLMAALGVIVWLRRRHL